MLGCSPNRIKPEALAEALAEALPDVSLALIAIESRRRLRRRLWRRLFRTIRWRLSQLLHLVYDFKEFPEKHFLLPLLPRKSAEQREVTMTNRHGGIDLYHRDQYRRVQYQA